MLYWLIALPFFLGRTWWSCARTCCSYTNYIYLKTGTKFSLSFDAFVFSSLHEFNILCMLFQSFNPPPSQYPPHGPQISPLQRPVHSPQQMPSSLQLQPLAPSSYSQPQMTNQTTPFSQALPSQPSHGQTQVQQIPSSSQTPLTINMPSNSQPNATNQQQMRPPVQQQPIQPSQQSPSQLAQMLSQQTQTLQASFQSSQQAFSQLQQQLQLMQPSHQNLAVQQTSQTPKQQVWKKRDQNFICFGLGVYFYSIT